ncbi:hypothetical protein M2101_002468 [Parabacteroides sp. PM5-20]|nr:hypothetical protein [Parabacteroides sp. PM5-20]
MRHTPHGSNEVNTLHGITKWAIIHPFSGGK